MEPAAEHSARCEASVLVVVITQLCNREDGNIFPSLADSGRFQDAVADVAGGVLRGDAAVVDDPSQSFSTNAVLVIGLKCSLHQRNNDFPTFPSVT